MRITAIVLGFVLIAFSSARITLETFFPEDQAKHRMMMRLGIGSDERLLSFADDSKALGTPEGLATALSIYREIVDRDPGNPMHWCELGSAFMDSGRLDEAGTCFRHALEIGPNIVQTLSRVTDFYMQTKQLREALGVMRRILEKEPQAAESIFYSYVEGDFEFPDTLALGLPEKKSPAQAYLHYLMRISAAAQAEQCWQWIAARSLADDKLAGDYIAFLLRIREYRQARDTWASYLGTGKGSYLASNFLYNPGMETELSGTPLDWNVSDAPGVDVTRDADIRHSGHWSLRIAFGGEENLAYQHVSQTSVLEPGTYKFRGWLRTDGITTNQGVRFRIQHPGQWSLSTGQATGTHDWAEFEETFVVIETGLVRVDVFRQPSERFNNKIAGTAWIDDLEITPVSTKSYK